MIKAKLIAIQIRKIGLTIDNVELTLGKLDQLELSEKFKSFVFTEISLLLLKVLMIHIR